MLFVAFHIFSLSLIFVSLINMYLSVFLLGFILYGTLCFLDLGRYFLSHIREVFCNLFKYFLRPFLSLLLLCCAVFSHCHIPLFVTPPGSSVPGDSPGKNTGVDYHALVRGIFPTQGSNPGLLYWRGTNSLPSEPLGKPYSLLGPFSFWDPYYADVGACNVLEVS